MTTREQDCLSDSQKALLDRLSARYVKAIDRADELLAGASGLKGQALERRMRIIEEYKKELDDYRAFIHQVYGPYSQGAHVPRAHRLKHRQLMIGRR